MSVPEKWIFVCTVSLRSPNTKNRKIFMIDSSNFPKDVPKNLLISQAENFKVPELEITDIQKSSRSFPEL